jgi:hypothetical protein
MGATRDMPDTLETCRQEALLVVDRCAQLLKNRYGAKRIIPFGSVLEEGTWHERSDLNRTTRHWYTRIPEALVRPVFRRTSLYQSDVD